MRIVIDMQGAQTESRFRGIGRYSLSLALAIAKNRGEHEVFLALSGQFPDTIEPIRSAFKGLLPQKNIRVWYCVTPTKECETSNSIRRKTAEMLREAFIASLSPNVTLITSLFEGFGDNAITSIGCFDTATPTVTILYDLIPLISPDINFRENPVYIEYYGGKISSLRRSSALLAISDSSRNEALSALKFDPNFVANISSGCDQRFRVVEISNSQRSVILNKFGVSRKFFMYTGGADERKNLIRLIQAFAILPNDLRSKSQLLLVGKIPDACVEELVQEGRKVGLSSDEILFGGYVSDLELMRLYSLCLAFVFPSLHEGFGLPPLEAMACGAPVITSNLTSLPEVVGREDAMFDPLSVSSISNKMKQVLTDERFRADLAQYGLERVKEFSWDRSAELAIKVMEKVGKAAAVHPYLLHQINEIETGMFRPNIKRILVSKLDHMGDLILAVPAIMKLRARYPYARIDAIVGSWNLEQAKSFEVFDKIYTFDFFSKKSADSAAENNDKLTQIIGLVPAYDLAIDFRRQRDTRFILLRIPSNYYVGYATGENSIDSRLNICLPASIDMPFVTTELNKISISKQMLALVDALPYDINDYIKLPVVSFQRSEKLRVAVFPKAGNDVKEWGVDNFCELIQLMAGSPDFDTVSVYVTTADDANSFSKFPADKINIYVNLSYGDLLESLSAHSICLANNSFGAHLASYIGLKVIGIYAGHETVEEWAPVFGDVTVIHRPVECSPCHIAKRSDCKNSFECMSEITPEFVFSTIQRVQKYPDIYNRTISIDQLIGNLLNKLVSEVDDWDPVGHIGLADCIAKSFLENRKARLFVDVSELAVADARTGIQRVTRSILKCLLEGPPKGFEIIPVIAANNEQGYSRENGLASTIIGREWCSDFSNLPIDYQAGDVFLGLDLQQHSVLARRHIYRQMRHQGVGVYFVVYDLLPVLHPDCFPLGTEQAHADWLGVVAENSGALCISKSVAEEYRSWISINNIDSSASVESFYLGSDIGNSIPTFGLPNDANFVLSQLKKRNSFILVGTIEPRKGYAQVLSSFEQLWASGVNVNLVIVGKKGWNMESFVDRLLTHPERGSRLFWLEGISDEYLEMVYGACTCLIAASIGEGFGLPLIEAAKHGLPIISRDIPVFREVAGDNAFFFNVQNSGQFSAYILNWIELHALNEHPKSSGVSCFSWQDSARMLLDCLIK